MINVEDHAAQCRMTREIRIKKKLTVAAYWSLHDCEIIKIEVGIGTGTICNTRAHGLTSHCRLAGMSA